MRRTHAALLTGLIPFGLTHLSAQDDRPRANEDDVVVVERGVFERVMNMPGVVTSSHMTVVAARIQEPAQLLVRVEEGMHVKTGEMIAELDASRAEDEAMRVRFARAEAEGAYRVARAAYEHARSSHEARGLEMEIEREELELALFVAQDELERLRAEVAAGRGQGGSGERALHRAEMGVHLAERRIELWKARREGAQRELEFETMRAEAEIHAAEERLRALQHAMDRAERGIDACRVKASQDGVFVLSSLDEPTHEAAMLGALIEPGTPIGWIVSPNDRQVTLSIQVAERRALRVGQEAAIASPVYPDRLWAARVTSFAPIVRRNAEGRDVVEVALALGEDSDDLALGLRVGVRLVVQRTEDAVLVPRDCVIRTRGRTYCLVVDGEGHMHERPVKLGPRNDRVWVIEEGLEAGERVVVTRG